MGLNNANQNANNSIVGNGNFNDFDHSEIVILKLRELVNREKKPVTFGTLSAELTSKISQSDLQGTLNYMQEMAMIKVISGPENSYDLR